MWRAYFSDGLVQPLDIHLQVDLRKVILDPVLVKIHETSGMNSQEVENPMMSSVKIQWDLGISPSPDLDVCVF